MDAGKVAILGVMGALFTGVVIWIIYAMVKTTPPSPPSLGVVPRTYKKDVTIVQYSLLPDFISGLYKARFSVGAPHMLYPPNDSIKSSDTHINDTFVVEIHPGMNIHYYMNRVSDDQKVFSLDYTVPEDIHNITKIYLCDGVIVDNRNFIPNFAYRFAGNWTSTACDTMILTWSSSIIKDVKSDDSISCDTPPATSTIPYTFNTVYSPETIGWKGAWVGMKWCLYSTSGGELQEFGSITLTNPKLNVLVAIHNPPLLKMSSS